MSITGGFGTQIDLQTGRSRKWIMGRDGVQRWADTAEPCERSTLTTAARAALSPPTQPHIFGDHQTVPPESISALRLAYNTIIQQLRDPATAKQALLDWAETLVTASMIAETIDRGVPELQPYIDDMHRLAVELEHTGQVLIDAAQYLRLLDAADVIDSLMRLAPHDVVLACAYRSEAMRREKP